MKRGLVFGTAIALAVAWYWTRDGSPPPKKAKLHFAVPIVNTSDLEAGIRYYTERLGFRHDWSHGNPADFASVSRGHVAVFLCQNCQGRRPAWIMVFVDDVDALHSELEGRGATIRQPPADREWGMREMLVEDADGNVIRFGHSLDDHGFAPPPARAHR